MGGMRMRRGTGIAGVALASLLTACSPGAPAALSGPSRPNPDQRATDAGPATLVGSPKPQVQATPKSATAAATPTAASSTTPRTAVVRRGPITEDAQLSGRVAGLDEVAVAFDQRTVPVAVRVKPGDSVSPGQILLESDSKQIAQSLKDARDALDSAVLRLQQSNRQAQDPRGPGQVDVATASDAVAKATANLAKVQAGATDLEKQSADAGVVNASAALAKAEADLASAQRGASAADIRAAEQQAAAAQLALRQAESEAAKLTAGPDPEQARTAERTFAAAQTALVTAQADYDRLMQGPDQYALRAAQREVDRARAALTAAEAAKTGPDLTSAYRDAAIAGAKLALQGAQDALAKLQEPARPDVVLAARTRVDDATAAVATGREKLDAIRKGPDQLAIDKANAAVSAARTSFQSAQGKLDDLRAGTSQIQLDALAAAVDSARVALAASEAKRDEVYGRPSFAELDDARRQVATAQAALDRARQQLQSGANTATADAQMLQREVDKAQQRVSGLEADLATTQLRSPIAGTVTQVAAQAGQPLEPGSTAVTIAKAGDAAVLLTLPKDSSVASRGQATRDPASRVAAGQPAVVVIDGGDGSQLTASVKGVVDGPGPSTRTAQVQVDDWGSIQPPYGATALVRVTLQQKTDALLVPAAAVRSAGTGKYVEYLLQDGSRQTATVEVGTSTQTDIEILSGVNDGQTVILPGPAPAPASVPQSTKSTGTPAPATTASSALPPADTQPAVPPAPTEGTPSRLAVLLDERFAADTPIRWLNDPQSTAWAGDGVYHLRSGKPNRFTAVAAPLEVPLQEVHVTAMFQKTGGPAGGGYGIVVRDADPATRDGTNQGGAFYVLGVGDLGQIGIWRREGSRWIDILPWTASDAVHPGTGQNELSVVANGSQLTFVVNGLQVASQTDSVLASGGVGLFVGGDLNEVSVTRFTVLAPS